jgi:hypothetical protein
MRALMDSIPYGWTVAPELLTEDLYCMGYGFSSREEDSHICGTLCVMLGSMIDWWSYSGMWSLEILWIMEDFIMHQAHEDNLFVMQWVSLFIQCWWDAFEVHDVEVQYQPSPLTQIFSHIICSSLMTATSTWISSPISLVVMALSFWHEGLAAICCLVLISIPSA